ncbi:MAG TPA: hypothetical protein VNO70_04625 [Blastocatellia bacterium]|nr:hypothetical protein [Blastocatellia bacterium]
MADTDAKIRGDKGVARNEERRRRFRPRWPATFLEWAMWLLVALLFYLLISRVLVPWWYTPVPTTPPPMPPATITGRA